MNPGSSKHVEVQHKGALIWKFFSKTRTEEAECNTCKITLKVPSGSTTTLIRHLNKHQRQKNQYWEEKRTNEQASTSPKTPRQQTLDGAFTHVKLDNTHHRSKAITLAIGKMMVLDYQPYSIVEDRGFREMVNTLEPRYEIPSRTVFSRRIIPDMYENYKLQIKTEMERELCSAQSLSLTTDMWTSRANESYISLTCHYMTADFMMKRYALANSYFPGQHTGSAVHQKLNSILEEWDLGQCTVPIYIVTDNARNLTAALSKTNWISIPCLAHTMQLAISDAKKTTPGFSELCQKGRSIVGHYRHSVQARERLGYLQKTMDKPTHNLIQDVETRWNSEYQMFARLLEQRAPISAELAESGKKIECFNQAEWHMVSDMVDVLQPIDQATTELCAESYPTLSMVIPVVSSIQTLLENHIKTKSKTGCDLTFTRNLLKAFRARFPDYRMLKPNMVAMVLDPRFKGVLLTEDEMKLAINFLEKEICRQQECVAKVGLPAVDTLEQSDVSVSLWGAFDQLAKDKNKLASKEQSMKDQVTTYLSESVIARHEDPCAWWKTNRKQFYCLQNLAQHYLSVPATQVASERLFSCAGNTVTVRRGNLNPEHVEQLVFLHHNMKQ